MEKCMRAGRTGGVVLTGFCPLMAGVAASAQTAITLANMSSTTGEVLYTAQVAECPPPLLLRTCDVVRGDVKPRSGPFAANLLKTRRKYFRCPFQVIRPQKRIIRSAFESSFHTTTPAYYCA